MPDPNNAVLREHGIVFMLLPKVANTSIKIAILKALGRPADNVHMQGVFECVSKEEAKGFPHRIAFVRDPLSRLASCYRDKIVLQTDGQFLVGFRKLGFSPGMSFLKFIERVADIPDEKSTGAAQHFRSMSHDLCEGDRVLPNVLGRDENLAADWAHVQRYVRDVSGLELPVLTHERETAGRAEAKYCPRGKAFALQRYRDDVRLFGYRRPYKFEIDPDGITVGRSICNVHREMFQIARDVDDPVKAKRLTDLIAEAFDMGKRMNAKLGQTQYE